MICFCCLPSFHSIKSIKVPPSNLPYDLIVSIKFLFAQFFPSTIRSKRQKVVLIKLIDSREDRKAPQIVKQWRLPTAGLSTVLIRCHQATPQTHYTIVYDWWSRLNNHKLCVCRTSLKGHLTMSQNQWLLIVDGLLSWIFSRLGCEHTESHTC